MLKNLTELSKQLALKQHQLESLTSELTTALIDQQNQGSKSKSKLMMENISDVAEEIKTFKKFFTQFVRDLKEYGEFPYEVMKVLKTLPQLYENMIVATEQKWKKILRVKDEEHQILMMKIEAQENEIKQLQDQLRDRKKNEEQNQIVIQEEWNEGDFEIESDLKKVYSEKLVENEIEKMEITIRENTDDFQKQPDQIQKQEKVGKEVKKKNDNLKLFTFENLIESLEFVEKKPKTARQHSTNYLTENKSQTLNYNKFKPNMSNKNTKKRTESINNMIKNISVEKNQKNEKFWNELQSNIHSKDTSPKGKENQRSLPQKNGDKKQLMSKLSDFRKLLFLDQGIKRFGIGLN